MASPNIYTGALLCVRCPTVAVWCISYLLFTGAHGANLPSTITAGYTTAAVGSTVPSTGTTLNVASMLGNAVASGRGAAVFHAEGLLFAGTLSISCPSTTSPYTIPLMVTIINGRTQAGMTASSHLGISGVLGGGSNVSIRGGSYSFSGNTATSCFLQLNAALTITTSSTLEVVGPSYTVPKTYTADVSMGIFLSSSPSSNMAVMDGCALSVVDIAVRAHNGSIAITNITIEYFNVDVIGHWKLFGVYIISASITISDGSNLTISNTAIHVDGMIAGSYWWLLVYYGSGSSSISLSNGSIMDIRDVGIELHNMNVKGSSESHILTSHPINISSGSILVIANTSFGVYNVSMGSSWLLHVLWAYSTIAVSSGGSLSIAKSTIGMYGVNVTGSLLLCTLMSQSPIAVSSMSRIAINSTVIEMQKANFSSSWQLSVLYTTNVTVASTATISVTAVAVAVRELRGVGASVSSVMRGGGVRVDGVLRLNEATVEGVFAKWMSATSVVGTGLVVISHIATAGTDDMVSVPQMLGASAPMFDVCRNYVNGTLCSITTPANYPCALNISQRVVEGCTATKSRLNLKASTVSASHSTTISEPTIEKTGTTTWSVSDTISNSPASTTRTSSDSSVFYSVSAPASNVSLTRTISSSSSETLIASATNTPNHSPSHSEESKSTSQLTSTLSSSPSRSVTATHNPSPTHSTTATQAVTPSLPPACPLDYSSLCPYTAFADLSPLTNATTNTSGCGYLALSVPFTSWSGGGRVNISVVLVEALGDFRVPSRADEASAVDGEGLVAFTHRLVSDATRLWVDVGLQYVGATTRGSWSVVVGVPLLEDQFSCRLRAARVVIPLTVKLEAAPPIPDSIMTAVDSLAVAAVAMPTGLIRGGMMSSLLGMMRCSQFNPDDSLSLVNNPTGWAIGASGLRYQRGSAAPTHAATALIVLCALGASALIAVCVLAARSGMDAAVKQLRLPSCVLPVVLLLSEVGVSSAVTLVVFDPSEGSDVVLGLAVLGLLVSYVVLQAVHVSRGDCRIEVVLPQRQSLLQYMLDPTHEVDATDKGWLRGNIYFVEGRSWPLFGVIETAFGMVSNTLEGIPLSVSVGGLCAARPACILVMSLVLLALLVWRVPNAVRLSQWCAVVVTALMCVCSAAVLANVVSPSETAEGAVTYIGLVVSVLNSVFGVAELVAMLLAVIPSTVSALGLRSRTFEALLMRGKPEEGDDDDDTVVPMLQLPSVDTTNTHAQTTRELKEQDDNAWVENMIAKVHAHNAVSPRLN